MTDSDQWFRLLRLPGAKICAVIFDLDGTVVDSEPNHKKANIANLKNLGLSLPDSEWDRFVGMALPQFHRILVDEYGLAVDKDEFRKRVDLAYMEVASTGTLAFEEIVNFAKIVRARGFGTAIASQSPSKIIAATLDFAGIAGHFNSYVSAFDIGRSKPEPDVFLEAARMLSVPPENCLIFEDSGFGILGALSSGASVIALAADEEQAARSPYSDANIVVPLGPAAFRAENFAAFLTQKGLWGEAG